MNEVTLMTHAHSQHLDTLTTLWRTLHTRLSDEHITQLIFPLLFLRLACIHADEELAETADICWAELIDSETPAESYQHLCHTLCDPQTWPEAGIFSALPSLEALGETGLEATLAWLQALDMYALQYRDIGEFWESCLHHCAQQHPSLQALCPPLPLINALTALLQPKANEHFYDPQAGSSGFLVAAQDYVHTLLEEQDSLPPDHTCLIAAHAHSALEWRLSLANLRLHDVPMSDLQLWQTPSTRRPQDIDVVLTHLRNSTDDIPRVFNQALHSLKAGGRALILLEDSYLSAEEHADWRRDWLQHYQLHTLLRLPENTFAQPTHALFFTTGCTETCWYYDLRTQVPAFTGQTEQLAQLLGVFTLAYGEDILPDSQQRLRKAAKDPRLQAVHLADCAAPVDLVAAYQLPPDTLLPPLPGISSPSAAASQWPGLLGDTLQDLQQLGHLLRDNNSHD